MPPDDEIQTVGSHEVNLEGRPRRRIISSALLPRRGDGDAIDPAAGEVKSSLRRRSHVSHHAATGWDAGFRKALSERVEFDEHVGAHTRLAVPDLAIRSDGDPVGL